MPNPAELAPSAVRIPDPELREATILEGATEPGQRICCVETRHSPLLKTDPMTWKVDVVPGVGYFYPKKGDRAVIAKASDGSPFILEWWPSATEPDAPLP
jgi:hypothetical protein